MPLATTKEVMIQVDWSVEAPRSPAMVGSETLAMVVSSTWVKVPMASAKAVTASAPHRADGASSGPSLTVRAVCTPGFALTSASTWAVDILAGLAPHHAGHRRAGDTRAGLVMHIHLGA